MSGLKPSFVTGANAKITLAGKTMAYAQDVSYAVTVSTIPVETMGRYEVVNHEPVAYFVEGTLSVVRYTKNSSAMAGSASDGNSTNQWGGGASATSTVGTPSLMFNPGRLTASSTFDVDIFQKGAVGGDTAVADVSVVKLRDCRFTSKGGQLDKRGILVERFAFNAIYLDDEGTAVSGSGDTDLA
jgi:hypothetical protein